MMFLGGLNQPSILGPKQHICECSVEFSGLISRRTCSAVAIELIKYVLVQRDQIPETFDSLLKTFQQQVPANTTKQMGETTSERPLQSTLAPLSNNISTSDNPKEDDHEERRLKPLIPKQLIGKVR